MSPVFTNLLLRTMPPSMLGLIGPGLQHVVLPSGTVLETTGTAIAGAYFLEEGMLSLVSAHPWQRDVEVGVIGLEGMSGVPLLLGDDLAAHVTNVQIAGTAWLIGADALRRALHASRPLHDFLLLYARTLEIQTTSTISANARGTLEERLARWLLMGHDRVIGDRLSITHEFLGMMLAARRPGVTVALQVLEGKGLIRSLRGVVIIIDREGLEGVVNGNYGEAEQEYERLLGIDPRPRRQEASALLLEAAPARSAALKN